MRVILISFLVMGLALPHGRDLNGQTGAPLPGLLVTTEWMEENLEDPGVVILHYGNPAAYEQGHIPGARLVSMSDLMVDHPQGLSHELPDGEKIGAVLKSWGIGNTSKVIICYGDANAIPMAARLFFTLDYAGLGNRTALLNGGLPAWKEENRQVTATLPEAVEGDLMIGMQVEVLAHRNDLLENLNTQQVAILDARPEGQYTGKARDRNSDRKGHIPGAVNIPFSMLTREDAPHLFKTESELRELFEATGTRAGIPVIVYCGSGIWASPLYFAARLLGYDASLYDGSMEDWGNDPSLSMVRDE